jgi:hypothetical protein
MEISEEKNQRRNEVGGLGEFFKHAFQAYSHIMAAFYMGEDWRPMENGTQDE